MATPPDFTVGQVLTAAQMNVVGLWRVTTCTVSSAGGTPATASNGVITVGSGNTSVTVSNAFSADYDSYHIVWSGGMMSADTALTLQVGSAVTGYYGAYVYGQYSSTAVTAANDNNNTRFTYSGGGDPFSGASAIFTLNNPFLTKQTYIHAPVAYSTNVGTYVGRLATATSYSSFTFVPFTGTMSGGTIRVYGYRK